MPTTPPRSGESGSIRPSRRTATVTGVTSPTPITAPPSPAMCGRVRHCSCHCAAYSPYSLRTFSTAEPSIGMGATLGRGPGLDQSKTSTWRTLDALPRMPGGRYPPQQPPRRPQELSGCRRDLRKARMSPRTTARPRFGEDDDF